jgi:hypothetical protein
MNKLFWSLAGSCILLGCATSRPHSDEGVSQVILQNTTAMALADKAITIERSRIKSVPRGEWFPLIVSPGKDTIAAQLDDLDGDKQWDELFFVVDLPARTKSTYTLEWVSRQPAYSVRTSTRFGKRLSATAPVRPATEETLYKGELPKSLGFQRYQTDGPSWENDKVGFRHYLDGRNAKDVFGKLVPGISPETVGINARGAVEDNYHVMEPWGRDILAVGNSVGIGGIALVEGDQWYRLGVTVNDSVNNVEKTSFRILTEGPVRSMLHFNYQNWKPLEDRSYQAEETTSIWPGMYAYENTVKVSGLRGTEHLGIGMVNINAVQKPLELKLGSEWVALLSHEKHTYNKEWWLGLALIVPAADYQGWIEAPRTGKLSQSYFAKLNIRNNQPLRYYAVAAWELSDKGFADPAYFEAYVRNLVSQLSAKVEVTLR